MRARRAALARIAVAGIVAGAGAILVAGCMPAPATEQARAVADLWSQFLVAAALVGGLVWILMTVAIVRYRRRASDGEGLPPQIADFRPLELAWTAGPIVIVGILFWLTLGALGRIDAHEPSQVTVDVTAFRWQWRFDYPGTGVAVVGSPDQVAEMVVPAGEPIHIVLSSADVAHSFYVPAFLFKRDAIPGRTSEFDVTVEQGTYGGQCAEFCGVFHDRMLLRVVAVTRPAYEAWLAAHAGTASPSASAGEASPVGSAAAAASPVGSAVAP